MTRTRDEIELDLPFAVNGALSEKERAEVEALMANDAQLKAEHAALTAIRERMQGEEFRSPGEFGLARLMRDVDRIDAAPSSLNAHNGMRARIWQAVAAIAVLGFLGQALLTGEDPQTARYELAGAGEAGMLVVSFRPDANEADIRGTLLDAGVEIVGGPSALGLYRLDPISGVNVEQAAASLRAATRIVESVENALD